MLLEELIDIKHGYVRVSAVDQNIARQMLEMRQLAFIPFTV